MAPLISSISSLVFLSFRAAMVLPSSLPHPDDRSDENACDQPHDVCVPCRHHHRSSTSGVTVNRKRLCFQSVARSEISMSNATAPTSRSYEGTAVDSL